jgi:hypothetical protein
VASNTRNRLGPGRELAVLATLRQTTARAVARRTDLAEWRVSRILAGVARPTAEELRVLREALFEEGRAVPPSDAEHEPSSSDKKAAGAGEPSPAA